MTPLAGSNTSPCGRALPCGSDQPVPGSVSWNGRATSAVSLDGATVIVNSRWDFFGTHQDAVGGSWSLSSTQNDQLPTRVGLPLKRQLESSAIPGGRFPLRIRYW